jgi:hypothetical protein
MYQQAWSFLVLRFVAGTMRLRDRTELGEDCGAPCSRFMSLIAGTSKAMQSKA